MTEIKVAILQSVNLANSNEITDLVIEVKTIENSTIWKRRFEIGDSLYDFEHQLLFGLIDNCIQLSRNNAPMKQIIVLLKVVESYLSYHFNSEEAAMGDTADERFAAHRAQHKYMLERLKAEIAALEDEKTALTAQHIAFTLYEWYEEHLLQEDIKLVH